MLPRVDGGSLPAVGAGADRRAGHSDRLDRTGFICRSATIVSYK